MRRLTDSEYSEMLTALIMCMEDTRRGLATEVHVRYEELPKSLRDKLEEIQLPPTDGEFIDKWAGDTASERKALLERMRRIRAGARGRFNQNRWKVLRHLYEVLEADRSVPTTGELAKKFGYEQGSALYVEASETRDWVLRVHKVLMSVRGD
jgi:hypothetical protein